MTHSKPDGVSVSFKPSGVALDYGQSDEDLARADLYGILSELFGAPPSDQFFNRLAASPKVSPDDPQTALTMAWQSLVEKAAVTSPADIREEFESLFIAVGKPDIVSNASFYLAGALNQQPLVDLRLALDQLGIERDPESSETEDHFAAVCEVMRYLVAGELGEHAPPQNLLNLQRDFFSEHLASWVFDYLDAVEVHRASNFYMAASTFARIFFEIERQAFDIYQAGDSG